MKTLSLRYVSQHIETWRGKTAVMRVDYNVPVREGQILDMTRIQASLPTLQLLLQNQVDVRILTHFGRPVGNDARFSTHFLCDALSQLLTNKIIFSDSWAPQDEAIVLYENVRFHEGEENNNKDFAQQLASLGDFYINDAFSVSHRAHASTEGITHFLPSYAGLALEHEMRELEKGLLHPQRPLFAIIGGAKVSSKWNVLQHILPLVDHCYIGGGMANTFLLAQGKPVGVSLVECDLVDSARGLLNQFEKKIHLPRDCVVATSLDSSEHVRTCSIDNVAKHEMIVDVGSETIRSWSSELQSARTVIWNGPMGVFEVPPFHQGTTNLMLVVAQYSKQKQLYSVIGGGETVAAATAAHVSGDIGFVSTAGGAFLEWLEGKKLPALIALEEKNG